MYLGINVRKYRASNIYDTFFRAFVQLFFTVMAKNVLNGSPASICSAFNVWRNVQHPAVYELGKGLRELRVPQQVPPTRPTMLASTAHMRAVSTITLQLRRRKLPPNKSTPRRGGLLLLLLLLAAGVKTAV